MPLIVKPASRVSRYLEVPGNNDDFTAIYCNYIACKVFNTSQFEVPTERVPLDKRLQWALF